MLLPLPLAGTYDYRVGEDVLERGDVVIVPLGRRQLPGVVWGDGTGEVALDRLRAVLCRLDCPPMPEATLAFVDWVAAYTLARPGAVLRMAMSVPEALAPPAPERACRPGLVPTSLRLTPARRKVIEIADAQPMLAVADLARAAGTSAAVVRGLIEAGALEMVDRPHTPRFLPPVSDGPAPILSPGQRQATDHIIAAARRGFEVALIDGVTGSGKTEVYFEAAAAVLAAGRQVLVLLPEIALSAQWLERFQARFGVAPALWHSEVPESQRRDTWRAVATGEAKMVVGARSALFLPFPALGLIVVDEEHDGAFKQEDGVCYHARDMAVVRGRIGGFPVVLASATPSLETLANVQAGRYHRLHLPDRHAGAVLPGIQSLDMRRFAPPRGRWLSPILVEAVRDTMAAGEQAMLFLNRRGYAPLTLCRACGFRLQCPHCTAWLVDHRSRGRLLCHHCGHVVTRPDTCPQCAAEDSFAPCGPGVERIAEEALALFPEARIGVMASDTISGPKAAAEFVRRITDNAIDLIIGTQIVAKGHHFPMLTLVGVVDADLGLEGGDLRAAERVHQLLSQVAGRAGRAQRPGRVLLQTFDPAHPVIAALVKGDRDSFIEGEAESRRAAGMPPFGRLAGLIVSGADAGVLDGYCRSLARVAPDGFDIRVLGPAPAPLALLRGRHRRRFLVKAPRTANLQAYLHLWLDRLPPPGGVRVQVDIDPYSFY